MQYKTGLIGLIVAILTVSCVDPEDKSIDYEDARRAAVDAWEEVIGRVSDECYDRTIDAVVSETGRFPESCMPPLELGKYVGCYMPTEAFGFGGDMIFIYADRAELKRKDTAVHEYIHLLSYCEFRGDVLLDLDELTECFAYYVAEEPFPHKCSEIPGDYFHLDDRLWDDYGPDTVEAVGCANLEL